MITVSFLHPAATREHLGIIPYMLDENNPLPAVKQLDLGYKHGGGWRPLEGYKLIGNRLKYPGDPPFDPLAEIILRNERIVIYDHEIVAVFQPDGSFEACRMD